jgi:DNA repair photolyase
VDEEQRAAEAGLLPAEDNGVLGMSAKYSSMLCKTALSLSRLPGLQYSLNPYVGCEHGCLYCYAPSVLKNKELAENWGKTVQAKKNIAEVLAKEVKTKPKGVVGVSTVCDPYQHLEAELELTRKCIKILAEHGFHVSIQTKSGLVLRDVDIIVPEKFDVGVTITTMDRHLASIFEPGAPPPDARAHVLEELSSRGVETWLFFGPIIPGMNDDEGAIKEVVEVASETKSRLIYDKLNMKEWVMKQLEPALELLKDPEMEEQLRGEIWENPEIWARVSSRVEEICRNSGVRCEAAFSGWPSRAF